MGKLNARQQIFVAEYLKDRNATQAAIRAGYSPKAAHVCGPRLLGNAVVREALDASMTKVIKKTEITAERILNRIGEIAFDKSDAKNADILKATELLGKHHKLFTEVQEQHITGEVIIATPEQMDAAIDRARKKV